MFINLELMAILVPIIWATYKWYLNLQKESQRIIQLIAENSSQCTLATKELENQIKICQQELKAANSLTADKFRNLSQSIKALEKNQNSLANDLSALHGDFMSCDIKLSYTEKNIDEVKKHL